MSGTSGVFNATPSSHECCSGQFLISKPPETIESRVPKGFIIKSVMINLLTKDAPNPPAPMSPARRVPTAKGGNIHYRALLEAAPDAIVVVNQSGAIVLVNAQAEALFGYRRDELIGQRGEILVPEHFRDQQSEQHSRFLAAPLERPTVAGLELFGLRKDGSEFPVEIRLSPLDTKQGMWVSSAIRDISDRRRTEETSAD